MKESDPGDRSRDQHAVADEEALGALVRAVRARDPEAEANLHARYRRFVEKRLVEARGRRNWFWLTDVEDAVQEVFLQFYSAVREGKFVYEGVARLEGFLVRTGWFVAMNLKDKAPRRRTVSLFAGGPDEEAGGVIDDLEAFAEVASERLHRRECTERLYRAIDALGGGRREVVLRTLEGQKVRQIVAALGKSAAAVSGLKFNALKDLREALEENGFVRDCGASLLEGGLAGLEEEDS